MARAFMAWDTVITVPGAGGPCRVEGINPTTGGKQVFSMSPKKVGQLLAGIAEEAPERPQEWLDLLGVSKDVGIAVQYQKDTTRLIVAFPPRTRTISQDLSRYARTAEEARATITLGLPATVWVMRFNTLTGRLTASWLLCTLQTVTSVRDTVLAMASPYGNTHDPLGAICWGNVSTAALRADDPIAVDNLFWATGFNDHIVRMTGFTNPETREPFADYGAWARWMRTHPGTYCPIVPGRLTFHAALGRITQEQE